MIANWLEWFNDYPQGILLDDLKEIEIEIGGLMGSMSIWSHHSEEREKIYKEIQQLFFGSILVSST